MIDRKLIYKSLNISRKAIEERRKEAEQQKQKERRASFRMLSFSGRV